ncbi:MAG: glycosyltransferase family 2 protein [Hyphomicrobiaceae bacterium]
MTDRPTLALLIPAYNAAAFLPRLLKSAQAQTVPFDQIWVYDDCSTDNTGAVAQAYGAKVLRGKTNKGCSEGKNALARHVETDFLHFHDADDELLPNFVSLAQKWIERDRYDVILFDYEWRDEESGKLISLRRFDPMALELDARAYAIKEQINAICGLYRRSKFLETGGYDTDKLVLYNEDVAFHIRQAFAGLRFSAESEVSIINWYRSNSMSSGNAAKCAIAHFHVLRRTLSFNGAEKYHREIGAKLWSAAGVLGSLSCWAEADQAARLASSLAPPTDAAGSKVFQRLATISPTMALRLREHYMRHFKPNLREKMSGH